MASAGIPPLQEIDSFPNLLSGLFRFIWRTTSSATSAGGILGGPGELVYSVAPECSSHLTSWSSCWVSVVRFLWFPLIYKGGGFLSFGPWRSRWLRWLSCWEYQTSIIDLSIHSSGQVGVFPWLSQNQIIFLHWGKQGFVVSCRNTYTSSSLSIGDA